VLKGEIYMAADEFIMRGNSTGSLRLYSQSGSIIYSADNGTSYIGQNTTNFFPSPTNTMNLGTSGNRWSNVNSVLGNFSGVLSCADGAVGTPGINFSADPDCGIYRVGTNNVAVSVGGSQVCSFLSSGNTQPLQPSFRARQSTTTNVTGDGTAYTLLFGTVQHNIGSNFNSGTGVFTAPIAGRYLFTASVIVGNLTSSHTTGTFRFSGDEDQTICNPWTTASFSGSGFATMKISAIVQMTAAQTISCICTISGSTKTVQVGGATPWYCFFSGQLLS
jgi:hypothetical protein